MLLGIVITKDGNCIPKRMIELLNQMSECVMMLYNLSDLYFWMTQKN